MVGATAAGCWEHPKAIAAAAMLTTLRLACVHSMVVSPVGLHDWRACQWKCMIPTGHSHVNLSPMARKLTGNAPRRSARERVFKTASELFYRKGIRAVGVETIAAKANTTKMGLYRNFPSKDELVAEWLRDHDAKFWQTWDTMSGKNPHDPRKHLKAAF